MKKKKIDKKLDDDDKHSLWQSVERKTDLPFVLINWQKKTAESQRTKCQSEFMVKTTY